MVSHPVKMAHVPTYGLCLGRISERNNIQGAICAPSFLRVLFLLTTANYHKLLVLYTCDTMHYVTVNKTDSIYMVCGRNIFDAFV